MSQIILNIALHYFGNCCICFFGDYSDIVSLQIREEDDAIITKKLQNNLIRHRHKRQRQKHQVLVSKLKASFSHLVLISQSYRTYCFLYHLFNFFCRNFIVTCKGNLYLSSLYGTVGTMVLNIHVLHSIKNFLQVLNFFIKSNEGRSPEVTI